MCAYTDVGLLLCLVSSEEWEDRITTEIDRLVVKLNKIHILISYCS
jgi:hypothetical protein